MSVVPEEAKDDSIEPEVCEQQAFAMHLREQFAYLTKLDTGGRQKNKINTFYTIALCGICSQSVPLFINKKAKQISEWSKLRVAFKTIIYKSASD
eukprot:3875659-Pyramimonas_sp.AAC.1